MRSGRWAAVLALVMGASGARAADCTSFLKRAPAEDGVRLIAAVPVAPAAPGTVRASPEQPPVAVALPGYCRVTGIIDARTGADGAAYGLRFALALPDDWNGRFLFQGGGGLNGTVHPPLGTVAAGDRPALARGFAVVATDGGHDGPVFDARFMADQRAALDFAERSLPTVTRVAKRRVTAFYGRAPAHSYMAGCSTGGCEAMLAAERYPELFDGIIVGAPAMRTGYSNLALTNARVLFNRAAPRDAAGVPLAERLYSPADKATILRGLLAQCDGLDGLKDGVIANPLACRFRPAALACTGAKTDQCLSAAQVAALEQAFRAPRDAAGRALYAAYPYDTGIVAEGPGLPGFLPGAGASPLGPPSRATTFDAAAAAARVVDDPVQRLIDTDRWTNLSTFLDRGGKILFFHGMSDPWFSALDTMDYYARAGAANGEGRWAAASRFYPVPGMGHCGGGADTFDRFDLLGPLVTWVERGAAPAAVIAARTRPTPATRPLCPLPGHVAYRGAGDPARAESFECRVGGSTPTGANG